MPHYIPDTFAHDVRRIGMLLDFGRSLSQIHEALAPKDECEFFLRYQAALQRHCAP